MLTAEFDRRPQALIGERRWHADVNHRHVGSILLDCSPEGPGVGDRGGNLESAVEEQLDESISEDDRILGDGDPWRHGPLGPQGKIDGHDRGPPRRAGDLQVPVHGPDPVGQSTQPTRGGTGADRLRPADTVVSNHET